MILKYVPKNVRKEMAEVFLSLWRFANAGMRFKSKRREENRERHVSYNKSWNEYKMCRYQDYELRRFCLVVRTKIVPEWKRTTYNDLTYQSEDRKVRFVGIRCTKQLLDRQCDLISLSVDLVSHVEGMNDNDTRLSTTCCQCRNGQNNASFRDLELPMDCRVLCDTLCT